MSTPIENPFHNLGDFGWESLKGSARSLPPELRGLKLDSTWIVEWNGVLGGGKFTKDHITSCVEFGKSYINEWGTEYVGAKVSMEVARYVFEVVDNGEVMLNAINYEARASNATPSLSSLVYDSIPGSRAAATIIRESSVLNSSNMTLRLSPIARSRVYNFLESLTQPACRFHPRLAYGRVCFLALQQ